MVGPDPTLAAVAAPHPALSALPLAGLRRLKAFDTVRARIGLAVDLGLLKPGERLPSSTDIADALGVGEMTVRRALVSLVADGVLQRRRGRDGGTLVAQQPARGVVTEIAAYESAADEVTRLIDHRLILECGLTHLAALHAGANDLLALGRIADDMDAASTWADFHRLDEQFHVALAEAAGIASAAGELRPVLHALYRYYLPYPIEYLHESNVEHRELLAAMERKDAVGAVQSIWRHVEVLHRTMFVGLLPAGDSAVGPAVPGG
jgi:GntR family transcriptional regulator, transcriptional repressor for pyruvate dehydrogenase complex